jgi:hypothetical protein
LAFVTADFMYNDYVGHRPGDGAALPKALGKEVD